MTPERRAEIEKRAEETLQRDEDLSPLEVAQNADLFALLAALSSSESKIAKAVEALEFYAKPNSERVPDFYDELDFGAVARTTLAMLKGETT